MVGIEVFAAVDLSPGETAIAFGLRVLASGPAQIFPSRK
jgi:hypothetical protein